MYWNTPRPINETEILKIKASVTKQIRAISKVEVEIFLFTSNFLGFVEDPVSVLFYILSNVVKDTQNVKSNKPLFDFSVQTSQKRSKVSPLSR